MLTTIIATIFVLGVLIFFHELGHFLVAKWSGIRVEKFSLGFPPSIIKTRRGDTEYAIGLIPLGGYVKMAGDNPAEELEGKPWEFMSKPVWKRFLVVIAGPFMNFVLAIFVLAGLYTFRGQEVNGAFINEVADNSPAAEAGITPGSQIISVDGITIDNFGRMAEVIYPKLEEPVEIAWEFENQIYTETVVTRRDFIMTATGDSAEVGMIGVSHKIVYEKLNIFRAFAAGFGQSVYYVEKVFEFVYGLITRQVDSSEIGGPIFIGKLAGATARAGIDVLLDFLALLSINLAVLNILPIPVFDGGHIMFLLFEKIKGSPPSLKSRVIAQQIGIVFILLLVVVVTFNDLTR